MNCVQFVKISSTKKVTLHRFTVLGDSMLNSAHSKLGQHLKMSSPYKAPWCPWTRAQTQVQVLSPHASLQAPTSATESCEKWWRMNPSKIDFLFQTCTLPSKSSDFRKEWNKLGRHTRVACLRMCITIFRIFRYMPVNWAMFQTLVSSHCTAWFLRIRIWTSYIYFGEVGRIFSPRLFITLLLPKNPPPKLKVTSYGLNNFRWNHST